MLPQEMIHCKRMAICETIVVSSDYTSTKYLQTHDIVLESNLPPSGSPPLNNYGN